MNIAELKLKLAGKIRKHLEKNGFIKTANESGLSHMALAKIKKSPEKIKAETMLRYHDAIFGAK